MGILKTILFPFVFFLAVSTIAQEDRLYIDFDDPNSAALVNNPHELEKYTSVYLKNTENYDNLDALLQQIKKTNNITSIIVTSYYDKKLPESLADCKSLNKITLLNCTQLNVKQFVKYIGKLPTLETINLGNCKIDAIPSDIKHCTQLRTINISMNNMLDLPTTIESLSACKNLTSMSLPVNQIAEIPENINLLTNLKELNLANNNLIDLPDEIGELDSLTSISMQKNIIVSPLKTYKKLNPLNIKFLSVDEVTPEELAILKERFPNAEIKQSKKPSVDLYELHQQFKDSIAQEIDQNRVDNSADPYVVKKRESIDVRAHSLAYLHYAEAFDPITNANYKGDSLTFDERYLDTNYFNTYRRQGKLPYDYFELTTVKSTSKNTVWFDFKLTEYFYYHFPEYFAFNHMSWVVVQPTIDKKEFKKAFIKHAKYTDFRLIYNDVEKNFLLQLKLAGEFKELTVIPKLKTRKKSTADEQSSYEMRYIKYLETLNNRRIDFDKELKDKKGKYLLELRKIRTKAWLEFSNLYLSEKEKSWTQQEWLAYYDEVIANQEQALLNAQMDFKYLDQYLFLQQYQKINAISEAESKYGPARKIQFLDLERKEVSITGLYVIDLVNKTYKVYKGSNAPMEFYLFAPDTPVAVIARLRNGNFSMVEETIENNRKLTLDEYPADYTQLYDLMSKLKML
ncbi:leucine-rich repeat domain-containing protein [Parvicella tangerina]|uniref:Leucine-rich repeat domain-containing protein n=1 Tax=Parvicella tangerina TaxID=2829795 RepID=A0A916JR83_9FLAO|nr:leucine-rich repeat domain-containing protein [Parvicella tangerina]CAG5087283.1 hypothetical protein CRYO30217_03441 [Parvicella tangerina]